MTNINQHMNYNMIRFGTSIWSYGFNGEGVRVICLLVEGEGVGSEAIFGNFTLFPFKIEFFSGLEHTPIRDWIFIADSINLKLPT